jgi:glucose-1-phosphate thymidylyltransferase
VNSVIGPHVSIGAGSHISNSVITDSLIQAKTRIEQAQLAHSMIGLHSTVKGKAQDLSIGDYTTIHT